MGIGKGYYKEDHFKKFTTLIELELQKFGAHIDATYYSPYHINAPINRYKRRWIYRKPLNSMIQKIFSEWNINKNKSMFIGDKMSDIKAATRVGLRGELLRRKNLFKSVRKVVPEIRYMES